MTLNEKVDWVPMTASNDLLGDQAALQERIAEEGFLYLSAVLDSQVLLHLRRDITSILAEEGWIVGGKEQLNAVAARTPLQEGEAEAGFFEVYDRVMKLESFYRLAHHEPLLEIMRLVVGERAFPHPLSIARLIFPKNWETATPPHQDYPNREPIFSVYGRP